MCKSRESKSVDVVEVGNVESWKFSQKFKITFLSNCDDLKIMNKFLEN